MNGYKSAMLALALTLSLGAFAQSKTTTDTTKAPAGNGPNMGTASDKSDAITGQDKSDNVPVPAKVTKVPPTGGTMQNNKGTGTAGQPHQSTNKSQRSGATKDPKPPTKVARDTAAIQKKDHTKVPVTDTTKVKQTTTGKPKGTAQRNATQHHTTPNKKPIAKDTTSTHPDGNGPNAGTVH